MRALGEIIPVFDVVAVFSILVSSRIDWLVSRRVAVTMSSCNSLYLEICAVSMIVSFSEETL